MSEREREGGVVRVEEVERVGVRKCEYEVEGVRV